MTFVRAIVDPDSLPDHNRRWDLATLGILAAMLLFLPAAFGAVDAWSELVVVAGAALLVVVLALRPAFDRNFRVARTWAYVPLALFLLLVLVQSLFLPSGLVRLISPNTVATKAELLGGSAPLGDISISFYPHATVEFLRLVLVGTVIFVTVASVFRRPSQIKELLLVIFIIGCLEAAIAIAQIATGAQEVYWRIPAGTSRITSGTFVNYSHFCQFMNLSIGAGVAFLLLQIQEPRRQDRHRMFRGGQLGQINWEKHGWILFGIVLCAVTVFTSLSRNGVISLLVATAVIGILLFRRGTLSWRGWLLGIVPFSVLCVLFVVGFDIVYERLATLGDVGAFEGRWQMTLATLRAWQAFPIWGTGLGTHEVVFPMFDSAVSPVLAAHADNDYAQLLEETGIVGALLVGVFIAVIATLAVQLMVRGRTHAAVAAFGLGLGLIAVAIHSGSDFGQRVPAVFALSATFCGLLVSLARQEARERLIRRGQSDSPRTDSPRLRYAAVALSLAAAIVVGGWALRGAYAAYLGERWWAAALAMDSHIQNAAENAQDQDFDDLLTAAESASQADAGNVTYAYWLNVYRWQYVSRAIDPNASQATLPADLVPVVERIADDLALVRHLCPTYGPPYALEGQLRLFILNEARGAALIHTALRLAPYDPATCLVAGELAIRNGDSVEAQSLLARAIRLRNDYFRDVAQICLELKQTDLARTLADGDYWRLQQLAAISAQDPAFARLADELHAEAASSLRRHASAPDAKPNDLAALANIDRQQGDFKSAVELYRRALLQEYNQVPWRLALAQALAGDGRVDDAIHEVRICLRIRPGHPPAKALLEKLVTSRRPPDPAETP